MAQQTAVEWLEQKIEKLLPDFIVAWKEEFDEAKQMEKEQIIKAYGEGYENAQNYVEIGRKEYYNKTYEI